MDEEIVLNDDTETDRIADELIKAILKSDEYLCYEKNLAVMKQNPELYSQVNELRRYNFMLQNSSAGKMSDEEYAELSNISKSNRQNPAVNDFLNAEVAIARLMQHLNRKITESIHFDIDFLG